MTDIGQDFFNRAQQILSDVAEAEAIAGESALKPSGLLRVSAPLSFGVSRMSQWLPGFIARYPDLRLDMDLSDRVVDLAADGIDVAVRIAKQPAATNVIARRIAAVPMLLCAAPAYLERKGRPSKPTDLVEHDVLNYSYLSSGDAWTVTNGAGEDATIRIRPHIHATNGEMLRDLAIGGHGVIAQPRFIVERAIASGALERVLADWSMAGFSLYAVYLSRKFLSAKVRVFIDYLSAVEGGGTSGESLSGR